MPFYCVAMDQLVFIGDQTGGIIYILLGLGEVFKTNLNLHLPKHVSKCCQLTVQGRIFPVSTANLAVASLTEKLPDSVCLSRNTTR